ncbi:MAG: UDP-2,3-diacylglucosamine diphosphatase [Phaeodactylibacter sp.]|nr:UDP-2,3-diacylglucosamine diphosphatase [Phaeodactylibacter sp.]MCB9298802.1 UDP-2,3-diacylglucosamine diphosphatase [Lewinellaceae bacterium]
MKRELDIVVLSDTHLGTYGCHAKELLNYLKSIKPRILILNGDFIDMWQFRKRYFPREHIQVLQRVLKMASSGTKVYYITGNHDDLLRRYSDFSSGNIHLRDKLILTLKGQAYWIFHGDIFDLFIRYSPFLSRLGGKGYDWLIRLNRFINKLRLAMGMSRMSFAKKVKHRVKEAVKFISDFENTALRLAAEEDYDFVICGHIHRPQMRVEEIQGKKITYLNSGDWVENLTALEYNWGRWSIYEYDEADYQYVNPRLAVKDAREEDDDGVVASPSIEEVYLEIVRKEGKKQSAG